MHKLCGCKFILFLDPGGTGFQTINLWEKKNCIPMGMRGHNLPLCRFIHQLIAWNLTSLTVDPRSRLARRALLLYMLPQIYVTHGRMMMSVSYFSYVIDKWACRWHDRGTSHALPRAFPKFKRRRSVSHAWHSPPIMGNKLLDKLEPNRPNPRLTFCVLLPPNRWGTTSVLFTQLV